MSINITELELFDLIKLEVYKCYYVHLAEFLPTLILCHFTGLIVILRMYCSYFCHLIDEKTSLFCHNMSG